MSEPFISEIRMWGLNFAPRMFADCSGQLMPIAQNQALFSLIGTIYGGDGRTTFALPDLRGRVPIHAGHGPGLSNYPQGSKAGTESRTLTTANLPPHTHAGTIKPRCSGQTAGEVSPVDHYPAKGAGPRGQEATVYGTSADSEMGPTPFTTAPTGSGIGFDVRQPFLTIRFCIATAGVFPSRN